MVDLTLPGAAIVPAPTSPGPSLSLSPEQVATMRNEYVRLGLDVTRFDARMTGTTSTPAVATGDPAIPAPPGSANPLARRLTDAQVNEAIADLQKYMPDEKIREALAKDGYEISEVSDEQLASQRHDADWGLGEEADPRDMAINYRDYGIDPKTITAQQDGNLRQFAVSLRLEQAPSFIGELLAMDQRVNSMGEASQKLWAAAEKQDAIRALGGPDQYAEAVQRVSGFLDALPKSSVKDGLVEGFSSKSAYFLRTMNAHVKRIENWHSSRPGKR